MALAQVASRFALYLCGELRWRRSEPETWATTTEITLQDEEEITLRDEEERIIKLNRKRESDKAKAESDKANAEEVHTIQMQSRRHMEQSRPFNVFVEHITHCSHGCIQKNCANCFNQCVKCQKTILGVICLHEDRCWHYGCCPEEWREAAWRASMDEEKSLDDEDKWIVAPIELEPKTQSEVANAEVDLIELEPKTQPEVADAEVDPRDVVTVTWFAKSQSHDYDFRLKVVRAFKLSNTVLEARFRHSCANLTSTAPNVKRLFHGTTTRAAERITSDGFRLPLHRGMFGKGVYFADTPQKSWAYCSRGQSESGYLIVCDVALGSVLKKSDADPSCHLQFAQQSTSCDSVTGLAIPQGVLRSPEYIIYNASQALPVFLLEVVRV